MRRVSSRWKATLGFSLPGSGLYSTVPHEIVNRSKNDGKQLEDNPAPLRFLVDGMGCIGVIGWANVSSESTAQHHFDFGR
jgi:hypothetical protein